MPFSVMTELVSAMFRNACRHWWRSGRRAPCFGRIVALGLGWTTAAPAVDYFSEEFSGGGDDFDLQNVSLLLTPDGSASGYSACTNAAVAFWTPTMGHATLALGDDAFTNIVLTGGETVALYGTSYSDLFVGSNGYITFGSGDLTYSPLAANHFSLPRISGFFNDLTPPLGGTLSYGQEIDRAVVTFDQIIRFNTAEANSFQMELFFDGRIRITWLAMQTADGIVGISAGGGVPGDYTESAISSAYGQCVRPSYFTELFDAWDFDLSNTRLTYTPDGSASYYEVCRNTGVSSFPVDPSGAAAYAFSDDSFAGTSPSGGTVRLYGESTNFIFVTSNGRLTFDSGTTVYTESLSEHFSQRGISAFFRDLNPAAGGQVSHKETADSWVVTYEDVPEVSNSGPGANVNSFQVELFFDGSPSAGVVRVTYLDVNARLGLVGLADGSDPTAAGGFVESDLSGASLCSPPSVSFASATQDVAESVGAFTVGVALSSTSPVPIEVPFTISGGSALQGPGADFEVNTSSPLTIPAGDWSNSVSLAVNDDVLNEAAETLTISLLEPSAAELGATTSHVATIIDNDPVPALTLTPVAVDEWAGTAVFEIALSTASGRDITVDFATVAMAAGAGTDFLATNGVLNLSAGVTNVQLVVGIVDDPFDEPDEVFGVVLSSLTHAVFSGGGVSTTAAATILDDDLPPSISVSDVSVPEDAGAAGFSLALSEASGRDITVDFGSSDISAVAPGDYEATNGTLVLSNGVTSGMLIIPIVDDAVYETNEAFLITFSNATHATLNDSSVVGTILSKPLVSATNRFAWSASSGWINAKPPGAGLVFCGPVLGGHAWSATLGWIGFGDGTPDAGPFYSNTSAADFGVNHEGAGNLSGYAWSATTGWIHFEQTYGRPRYEIATGRLSGYAWSATCGWINLGEGVSNSVAFVVDDPAPVLAVNDLAVSESDGTATFTVTRSGSATEVDVAFEFLTADQAAVAGDDYVAANGVVALESTTNIAQIHVTLLNDSLDESSETFRLELARATHATIADAVGEATIHDDGDPAPTLSIVPVAVDEDAGVAQFTVLLTGQSGQDVLFQFGTSNITAVSGLQFIAANGSGQIAAGQLSTTVEIAILDNGVDNDDSQFAVVLTAISNAVPGSVVGTATIQDDEPVPDLFVEDVTVSEDAGDAQFTVILSQPSGRDVQFGFVTTNGTATAPLDYGPVSGTATIVKGQPSVTLGVPVVLDNVREGFETFTLSLSNPVHGILADGSATATITPASTISAGKPYSWAANTAWINWRAPAAGAVVTESILCGYIWSATSGWICLGNGSPTNGIRYTNLDTDDFGVNRSPAGLLTGYAWSAATGWIHFEQTFGKPRIDGLTGRFSGYAWSATSGWINLGENTGHHVQTDRIEIVDSDGDGIDDAWEQDHFMDLSTAGPGTDFDEDDMDDSDEFLSNTNPKDADSFLRVRLLATTPVADTYRLEFYSSPARLYRIEVRQSLTAGAWADSSLGLFAPDAGTLTTREVTVPASDRYAFRVVAVRPLTSSP